MDALLLWAAAFHSAECSILSVWEMIPSFGTLILDPKARKWGGACPLCSQGGKTLCCCSLAWYLDFELTWRTEVTHWDLCLQRWIHESYRGKYLSAELIMHDYWARSCRNEFHWGPEPRSVRLSHLSPHPHRVPTGRLLDFFSVLLHERGKEAFPGPFLPWTLLLLLCTIINLKCLPLLENLYPKLPHCQLIWTHSQTLFTWPEGTSSRLSGSSNYHHLRRIVSFKLKGKVQPCPQILPSAGQDWRACHLYVFCEVLCSNLGT